MTASLDIGYFTKRNGARIAFGSVGEGYPVLLVPGWTSSLDQWGLDERPMGEFLAERFRVITYDKQGTGLSDRELNIADGFERHADEAIELLDHLDIAVAAMIGTAQTGPVVVDAAARCPARVSRPVVVSGYAKGPGLFKPEAQAAMVELIRTHWGYGARVLIDMFNVHPTPEEAERAAVRRRAQASAETAAALLQEVYEVDISDRLGSVFVPTLVIHGKADRAIPYRGGQELAAGIPGARFLPIEGASNGISAQTVGLDRVLAEIRDFLQQEPATSTSGGFQTILFTDLESSTALTQRLGDEAAQELLHGHNEAVRAALDEHGGREVEHTGDGIMASFPSAVGAVAAALQMQRELEGGEVRVRIGLNAGEPIVEDDDLFGLAVIKAARIADRADPGTVLVSRVVMELCEGKTFEFTSMGEASLKGFDEPVALYEVRQGAEYPVGGGEA